MHYTQPAPRSQVLAVCVAITSTVKLTTGSTVHYVVARRLTRHTPQTSWLLAFLPRDPMLVRYIVCYSPRYVSLSACQSVTDACVRSCHGHRCSLLRW